MRRSTALAGLGAGALATAGALAQRRLLRAIAADPERDVLRRPLRGEERKVRAADGTALHVEEFGPAEAPKLVLVHGWMCGLGFWRYQLDELSGEFRVIAYDKRGHGRSGVADDYSFEAFADDLDAVMEACVPEGERALVAGHSMGAMTLAAWAARHSERARDRLAGALLVNTGLGGLISEAIVFRTPERLVGLREPLGRLFMTGQLPSRPGPSPVADAAVRYVALSPGASPARVAFCREMVLSCSPRVRGACGTTMSRMDLWHTLEHLDVPTVVIAGELDKLTPPSQSRKLAEGLAEPGELVVLAGIGHMAPIEAPEEVSRRISELAARTVAAEPAPA